MPNGKNGGDAALAGAAMAGSTGLEDRLPDAGTPPCGTTPLHAAAFRGEAGLCAELLALGADLSARDSEGATPLHLACGKGHAAAARVLLEAGADPSAPDAKGRGPLFQAAGASSELVRLLAAAGAGVNQKDASGFTPLHEASLCLHAGAVQALLELGADPNAEAGDGSRPLDLCYGAARVLLARSGAFPGRARFADLPDWGGGKG